MTVAEQQFLIALESLLVEQGLAETNDFPIEAEVEINEILTLPDAYSRRWSTPNKRHFALNFSLAPVRLR